MASVIEIAQTLVCIPGVNSTFDPRSPGAAPVLDWIAHWGSAQGFVVERYSVSENIENLIHVLSSVQAILNKRTRLMNSLVLNNSIVESKHILELPKISFRREEGKVFFVNFHQFTTSDSFCHAYNPFQRVATSTGQRDL